ncbi:MAG: TonB-dependent receptor [Caulobacteraceae bacterium]|nr:TonB-dependent receptor [Caulobacteraceae bacterium]
MKTNHKIRLALLASVAFGDLLFAGAALAQQSAAANVDEVVVTAERRSENVQKVPISVGVLSGEATRSLLAGGDDTLLALSGKVPGLYAETTTGRIFPRFYIRGLGNIDFYLGASQPVEIIQDDVVLEHVVLKSNPVFDTQQVEVLRGPQGTLFGRNTTAGIIKFDSIKPSQTPQARAQLSYGSYNTVDFDGGIGGPLVADKVAARVSVLVQHRDNWVDNTYTGVSADGTVSPKKNAMGGFDERDARLQFLVTPNDRLTILASGHGRDYDGTSTLFLRGAITKGSNSVNVPRDKVAYDEADNNPQAYKTYGGSINTAYNFGPATLTSITAYETTSGHSRGDTDGGAAANFGNTGYGQSEGQVKDLGQFSEELRLASNGADRLKWQFGGMYFSSRDVTDFFQRAYFLTTSAHNPNNWVELKDLNNSWAVFGQVDYKILPDLTLTAGIRETEDTKQTRLVKTANTIANAVTYTGRRFVKMSATEPSWDISLLYQVNPDVAVYTRLARGFRGPTIQGRSAVFNSDFTTATSEKILSYEAGVKSTLLDGKLRLNATGFAYQVDDIQLNGNDSNGNGVLFNANKAIAYGMEAEAEWKPMANLSLNAGLSLLHSEIQDKRVYAQVCALNGVVVCTVENPTIKVGSNTFAQINGNPLPNAPEYNLNFSARYDLPLNNGGKLFAATDWNVQGYTSFVLYKTKEFNSNGNFEGGLRLGYTSPGRGYELAVFARNLTDEKNLKGVIENYMAAVYNEPRIIGVSLNYKM